MTSEIATTGQRERQIEAPARFRVRAFDPADYVAVYEAQDRFTVPDPLAAGKAYQALGPCFTGWFHDAHRPSVRLGCAGLSSLGHGVCEAWALLSPVLQTDRVARRWWKQQACQRIPILMGEHGYRRAEANVGPGGLGFAWALGFKTESAMPRWGPNGETFYKLVRFWPTQWEEVG